jgi:hypothetical protein
MHDAGIIPDGQQVKFKIPQFSSGSANGFIYEPGNACQSNGNSDRWKVSERSGVGWNFIPGHGKY